MGGNIYYAERITAGIGLKGPFLVADVAGIDGFLRLKSWHYV
jgi:hypothetical protein